MREAVLRGEIWAEVVDAIDLKADNDGDSGHRAAQMARATLQGADIWKLPFGALVKIIRLPSPDKEHTVTGQPETATAEQLLKLVLDNSTLHDATRVTIDRSIHTMVREYFRDYDQELRDIVVDASSIAVDRAIKEGVIEDTTSDDWDELVGEVNNAIFEVLAKRMKK